MALNLFYTLTLFQYIFVSGALPTLEHSIIYSTESVCELIDQEKIYKKTGKNNLNLLFMHINAV